MWDRLIPQAELMCNLLYQSNVAPKLLAQAYAFGPHDFNWMPLAPMGCAVQIHENRVSVERGVSTQLMDGTSRHCHTAICDLRSGVNTQEQSEFWTLCFLNITHITNTTVYPEYAVLQAAKELTAALKGRMPSALEGSTVQELEKLDNIFNQTVVT